jgi:hypothetical protein
MPNSNKRFGLELVKALRSRHMMEADLMRAMIKQGNRITRQYINMMVHGDRTPPPDTIAAMCQAMALMEEERVFLYRAAAIDSGYRIGALRG